MSDIVERLRERLNLRYMSDCKCGKCQLVHGDDVAEAADEIERLREALRRAETILSNMAEENNSMFNRWPIHHEPLRADARNLLPQIRAALGEGKE